MEFQQGGGKRICNTNTYYGIYILKQRMGGAEPVRPLISQRAIIDSWSTTGSDDISVSFDRS